MKQTTGRVTQGLSFETDILPKAKNRAKERRQSLSAYVCGLISADLGLPATPIEVPPVTPESVPADHPKAA